MPGAVPPGSRATCTAGRVVAVIIQRIARAASDGVALTTHGHVELVTDHQADDCAEQPPADDVRRGWRR